MKPVPKEKKKKKPYSLKTKIINTMSKAVRLRDKYCVTCGTADSLQDSHYIPRANLGTAFHPDNNNAQCSACHMRWHYNDPTPYTNYMINHYGVGIFDKLYALKHEWTGKKYPAEKLNDWLKYWEEELWRLQNEGGAYD